MKKLIDEIFENRPVQWGLRGDPYMWQELMSYLSKLKDNLSQIEFEEELDKLFNKIIEQDGKQTSKDKVWFEKFPQLGMSGGIISLKWWQEIGLPQIKNNYNEFNK